MSLLRQRRLWTCLTLSVSVRCVGFSVDRNTHLSVQKRLMLELLLDKESPNHLMIRFMELRKRGLALTPHVLSIVFWYGVRPFVEYNHALCTKLLLLMTKADSECQSLCEIVEKEQSSLKNEKALEIDSVAAKEVILADKTMPLNVWRSLCLNRMSHFCLLPNIYAAMFTNYSNMETSYYFLELTAMGLISSCKGMYLLPPTGLFCTLLSFVLSQRTPPAVSDSQILHYLVWAEHLLKEDSTKGELKTVACLVLDGYTSRIGNSQPRENVEKIIQWLEQHLPSIDSHSASIDVLLTEGEGRFLWQWIPFLARNGKLGKAIEWRDSVTRKISSKIVRSAFKSHCQLILNDPISLREEFHLSNLLGMFGSELRNDNLIEAESILCRIIKDCNEKRPNCAELDEQSYLDFVQQESALFDVLLCILIDAMSGRHADQMLRTMHLYELIVRQMPIPVTWFTARHSEAKNMEQAWYSGLTLKLPLDVVLLRLLPQDRIDPRIIDIVARVQFYKSGLGNFVNEKSIHAQRMQTIPFTLRVWENLISNLILRVNPLDPVVIDHATLLYILKHAAEALKLHYHGTDSSFSVANRNCIFTRLMRSLARPIHPDVLQIYNSGIRPWTQPWVLPNSNEWIDALCQ